MNLIKFKDTVIKDLSLSKVDWYNENLRGKYVYWIRCHYVVPIESITPNMYVSFETTINNLLGYLYYILTQDEETGVYSYEEASPASLSLLQKQSAVLVTEVPDNPRATSPAVIKIDHSVIEYADLWEGDYYWMNTYIDNTETDVVNNVDKYKVYNSYIPSGDLVRDDLKRFRTWLATSLLDMNYTFYEYTVGGTETYTEITNPSLDVRLDAVEFTDMESAIESEIHPTYIKIKNLNIVSWDEDTTHMLEYYRGGMYDETLKWIDVFGKRLASTYNTENKCSCGCNTNISSLYSENVSVCNPDSIYRSGLKQLMVNLFSVSDTWASLPSTYILLVKEYIDGIIQANFGLDVNDTNNYYGCECLSKPKQEGAMAILKQLSAAFGYIADGDVSGHKNFINTVLKEWSSDLYELMEWK